MEKDKLKDITLSEGEKVPDYKARMPERHKEVAAKVILNCLWKGCSLNERVKTRECHANFRKILGVK